MPNSEELYEQVVAEVARRRRRRRQAAVGSGAAAVLVAVGLAVAGLALGRGDDGEAVVADGFDLATTTATTSQSPSVVSAPTTGPGPTPTSVPPGCRNSRDPACGPFYWDPLPVDEPTTFTVTFQPARPAAGQPVLMTVEAHDAEAEVLHVGADPNLPCFPQWGDSEVDGGCLHTLGRRVEDPPRTGPWDPPAPVGATAVASFEHVYAAPGTYTVTVYAVPLTSESVRSTDYDVYGGDDSHTVTVTVE